MPQTTPVIDFRSGFILGAASKKPRKSVPASTTFCTPSLILASQPLNNSIYIVLRPAVLLGLLDIQEVYLCKAHCVYSFVITHSTVLSLMSVSDSV